MKKSLVLHIGLPKTGTTSFQNLIRLNSEGFKQAGVFVPTSNSILRKWAHLGLGRRGGLHVIPRDIARENTVTLDAYLESFEESNCQVGILSSEGFSRTSKKGVDLIKKQTRCYTVKTVCVFRHPLGLARSLFCSRGRVSSVTASHFIERLNNRPVLHYRSICNYWASIGDFTAIRFEDYSDITRALLQTLPCEIPQLNEDASMLRESLPAHVQIAVGEIFKESCLKKAVFLSSIYPLLLDYVGSGRHLLATRGGLAKKATPFSAEEENSFFIEWKKRNLSGLMSLLTRPVWGEYGELSDIPRVDRCDVEDIKKDFLHWVSGKVENGGRDSR